MKNIVKADNISIGQGSQLVLISGPCVIENYEMTYHIASFLKELTQNLDIPFIFKASYDKANRSSINSFRGPGLADGLDILERIKTELGITVISDVHRINEIEDAARVLDIIQIPAFLCRQTDFILKVAETGKPINVKKGQFLSPWDVKNIVDKVTSTGNRQILLTERGTMFGYNNLVVDFRAIKIMQDMGCPVIFDATHSIQLPGGPAQLGSFQLGVALALGLYLDPGAHPGAVSFSVAMYTLQLAGVAMFAAPGAWLLARKR